MEEISFSNNFRASFAHKTNHSFMPNAEFVSFEHPRFGLVPCILATHDIMEGEEIFVHYGYDLTGKKTCSGTNAINISGLLL
jgi:hypothetical protein